MTQPTLRLAYITNNAYDSIALMRGNRMLAHWTVTPAVIAEYLSPGDLEDWASNQVTAGEDTTIADLGEELTGDALAKRLESWTQ